MNKLLAALLLLSVSANAWLWFQQAPTISATATTRTAGSPASEALSGRPSSTARAATEGLSASFKNLQDADPAALCAALRASGVPPAMVRSIVSARIRLQHQAELAALEAPGDKDIWWRTTFNSPSARELNDKRERLNERIRAEVNAALGEPPPNPAVGDARYNYLAADKAAALLQIEKDYNDLRRKVSPSGGPITPEEGKLLEQEKRRDLAALLTPDELAEYDVRFAPNAMQLKMRLGAIDGTEAEYRWLYAQQQRLPAAMGGPMATPMTPATLRERDAAYAQFQTDVLQQFGAERGAEYIWQNDQDYLRLRSAARDNTIAADVPAKVMSLRDETGRRAYAIAQDTSLNQQQKQVALADLAATARVQLNALVPPQAGTGVSSPQWLQGLEAGRATRWESLTGSSMSTTIRPPTPPRG
jgi:hypothetical protein